MNPDIETLGLGAIIVLLLSFVLVIGVMIFLLWIGWFSSKKRGSLSPYSKMPMKLGIDIAPSMRRYVDEFILSHTQPENEPFDFDTAAICQETGRIFPKAVIRGQFVRLGWDFLERRYPGTYVSWGSLSQEEQATLRMLHDTLAGYQIETSCPLALPSQIDSYYALTKPGPLYVDRVKKVLLGWKEVPGTEFEVLIVQLPLYESIEETL